MPRRVEFEGRVQEFPDDATDDEIRTALEGKTETSGPVGRFFSGAWEMLNPLPALQAVASEIPAPPRTFEEFKKSAPAMLLGPPGPALLGLGKPMVQQSIAKGKEAVAAASKGDPIAATFHTMEAVPVAGPVLGTIYEKLKSGDYAGALGTVTALAAPWAAEKLPALPLRTALTPAEVKALKTVQARGVPVDLATATGTEFATNVAEGLQNIPIAGGRVSKVKQMKELALPQAGRTIAREISPTSEGTKFAAGTGLHEEIPRQIATEHVKANLSYDTLREIQEQTKKKVQTGERTVYSGEPDIPESVTRAVEPVFEEIAMPVDISKYKKPLQPLLDFMENTMQQTKAEASPGLMALRNFMSRPNIIDAATLDADLGAIKQVAKRQPWQGKGMLSQSQRLAIQTMKQMSEAVDEAIKAGGPEAEAALKAGREATKKKYALIDVQKKIASKDPVKLINSLITREDTSIRALRTIQKFAPDAMPEIGRAAIEGILRRSTGESGKYIKARSALTRWRELGEETKNTLFTPEKVAELDDFFSAAAELTKMKNPSGSWRNAVSFGTGVGGWTFPYYTVTGLTLATIASRILASPKGGAMILQGASIPLGSAASKALIADLAMRAGVTTPKENQLPPPPQ